MKKYLIAVAIIVVLAAAGAIGYERFGGKPSPIPAGDTATTSTPGEQPPLYDDDKVMGDPNAPVTMIEYASLTCPHCAAFETETLPKIQKNWIDTGKAKLVYRNFPFDKPGLQAAMVASCAPPERYFNFIEVLFQQQAQWAAAQDPTAALARIAKLGGMSDQQFQSCLANKDLENKIVAQRLAGEKEYGVGSTPTFFINGRKIVGAQEYEKFDEALQAASPKS